MSLGIPLDAADAEMQETTHATNKAPAPAPAPVAPTPAPDTAPKAAPKAAATAFPAPIPVSRHARGVSWGDIEVLGTSPPSSKSPLLAGSMPPIEPGRLRLAVDKPTAINGAPTAAASSTATASTTSAQPALSIPPLHPNSAHSPQPSQSSQSTQTMTPGEELVYSSQESLSEIGLEDTQSSRERGLSVASDITADTLLKIDPSRQAARLRGKSAKDISLDDVRKTVPREHESDTRLILNIEKSESDQQALADVTDSVLGAVPDEAVALFASAINSTEGNKQSSKRGLGNRSSSTTSKSSRANFTENHKVIHARRITLDQELYGLTAAMDALNDTNLWDEAVTPAPAAEYSAGDALQQNATLLYQRITGRARNDAEKTNLRVLDGVGVATLADGEASSISSAQTGSGQQPTTWRESLRNVMMGSDSNNNEKKKNDDSEQEQGLDVIAENDVENPSTSINKFKNSEMMQPRRKSALQPPKVFREFQEFLVPQQKSVNLFLRIIVLYVILPLLGIAVFLFYVGGNPTTGILSNSGRPNKQGQLFNEEGVEVDPKKASVSWWLLFVLRQALTGCMAKALEFILIDFLSIRSSFSIQLFGPWLVLFALQSRGWPFLLFLWGILDFALLAGAHPFFSHWLYGQDKIKVFTEANPGGHIIASTWNHRVLAIAVSVGIVVSIKRFWLGLYLGRQTFALYSGRLAKVMRKIVLITETATLARKLEKHRTQAQYRGKHKYLPPALTVDGKTLAELFESIADDTSVGDSTVLNSSKGENRNRIIDPNDRHPLTGSLSGHQKAKITQLLGAWEEPRFAEEKQDHISVNAILQFRRALACLYTPFPFSKAFGLADTRENCVESAQEVFHRLSSQSPGDGDFNFEVIALLGVEDDGNLDQRKLKELIRLFRPDRDGVIDILSFAKAIDLVYKEIRLLRAAVLNSSKIDKAFENILNIIFYGVVITVLLSQLGYDPLALFLSFSGVVLAFAFMISSASSKYFEGLLFILVRRPFQIGDAIHVSNVESETSYSGSAWWIVEDVNLFTTKAVFLYTMERCSLSNGSLANSRIINSSQSSEAYVWFTLKFPIDITVEKLKLFTSSVEQFVKNRPREWLSYADCRALRVEHSKGYIEYLVGAQHRTNWADWSTIMLSKSDLVLFCSELQKKMGVYYKSPPLPVDISAGSLRRVQELQTSSDIRPLEEELALLTPDIAHLETLIPPRGLN